MKEKIEGPPVANNPAGFFSKFPNTFEEGVKSKSDLGLSTFSSVSGFASSPTAFDYLEDASDFAAFSGFSTFSAYLASAFGALLNRSAENCMFENNKDDFLAGASPPALFMNSLLGS